MILISLVGATLAAGAVLAVSSRSNDPAPTPVETANLPDADLRIIVDRRKSSIEVFTYKSADSLLPMFGADPNGLAAADGRVYFGELRETGTFDFGDTIVAKVGFTVDGAPVTLEAMSVMVHPIDNGLPFETPLDGNIAMSVCNVEDPVVPPTMADLSLYGGFIAYPVDGHGDVTMRLPNTEPLSIDLITFAQGKKQTQERLTVPASAEIPLPPVDPFSEGWLTAMFGG